MSHESDIKFGQVAVGLGFLSKEEMERSLDELAKNGQSPGLMEHLRRQGLLSDGKIQKILGRLHAKVMQCPKCGARYIYKDAVPDDRLVCRRCRTALAPAGDDSPDAFSLIGKTIAQCRIESKIGEGGMGAIYKGMHVGLGRPVAVKILPARIHRNEEYVKRFVKEARAAAQLDHPNIVSVYDVGIVKAAGGFSYIVMQYIDGESLQQRLEREHRLDVHEATRIMRDAVEGLAAAHSKRIIHRDIKPGNILLAKDGSVKVTDFGLAKSLSDSASITVTGQLLGTPGYMSPEQARGEKVDARSDIYSLGVTYYHCLCGVLPYVGTSIDVIRRHADEAGVPPVRELDPSIPEEVALLLARMVEKDPARRYQTATDLKADLNQVLLGKRPYFFIAGASGGQQPLSGMQPLSGITSGVRGPQPSSPDVAAATLPTGLLGTLLVALVILAAAEGLLLYRSFRPLNGPPQITSDPQAGVRIAHLRNTVGALARSTPDSADQDLAAIVDGLERIEKFLEHRSSPEWLKKTQEARKTINEIVASRFTTLDQEAQTLIDALRFDEAAAMYREATDLGISAVTQLAQTRLAEIDTKKSVLLSEMTDRLREIRSQADKGKLYTARRSFRKFQDVYPLPARNLFGPDLVAEHAKLAALLDTKTAVIRIAPGDAGDVTTLTEALTLASQETQPITIELPEAITLQENLEGVPWEKLRSVPLTVVGTGPTRPTIAWPAPPAAQPDKAVHLRVEGQRTFRNLVFVGATPWPKLGAQASILVPGYGADARFENCEFRSFDTALEVQSGERPGIPSAARFKNCVFLANRVALRFQSLPGDHPVQHELALDHCVFYGVPDGVALYERAQANSESSWKLTLRNTAFCELGTVLATEFVDCTEKDDPGLLQVDADFNAYYNVANFFLPLGAVRPRRRDARITDFVKWRLWMRTDGNSLFGKDPAFENTAAFDFRLSRKSPLRRKGENNTPIGLLTGDTEPASPE
ncbi:MAG: serine/threonine-protein kinase [Planctomycetota bacterium]